MLFKVCISNICEQSNKICLYFHNKTQKAFNILVQYFNSQIYSNTGLYRNMYQGRLKEDKEESHFIVNINGDFSNIILKTGQKTSPHIIKLSG